MEGTSRFGVIRHNSDLSTVHPNQPWTYSSLTPFYSYLLFSLEYVMPRKYYCDFCDCSFPDNATNRTKHLQGSVHQANRKYHYDWFKDPDVFITEQMQKPACRHFYTHGYCEFGLSCKFSHITYTAGKCHPVFPSELVEWLHHQKTTYAKTPKRTIPRPPRYRLPAGWKVQELPVSLQPPSRQGYNWTDVGYWG
ncbi:hypothetical protein BDF14DRAFT_1995855 [Spinellus fusiger]|nr:hypothetical protein BDF14DRAFT_1995855 [Spinellus fusiger]